MKFAFACGRLSNSVRIVHVDETLLTLASVALDETGTIRHTMCLEDVCLASGKECLITLLCYCRDEAGHPLPPSWDASWLDLGRYQEHFAMRTTQK